jgi:hypothetical protein
MRIGKKWVGRAELQKQATARAEAVREYPILKEENERLRRDLAQSTEMLAVCVSVLRGIGYLPELPAVDATRVH